MDTKVLGKLLIERLAPYHDRINWDALAEFVGTNKEVAKTWFRSSQVGRHYGPPKGERLNRLWHLVFDIGIDSPELDELKAEKPYHYFVGQLHAYRIVPLKTDNANAFDLLDLLGVKNEQDALRVLRGDQTPVKPLYGKVAGTRTLDVKALEANYGEQLAAAKTEQRELVRSVLLSEPTTLHAQRPHLLSAAAHKPSTTLPPAPAPEEEDPADKDEPVTEPRPVTVIAPVAAVEAEAATTQPVAPVVGDQHEHMIKLACQLIGAVPLVNLALSDNCTDEDRAFMRQLVGPDNLHTLRLALTRLTSTDAFNKGK